MVVNRCIFGYINVGEKWKKKKQKSGGKKIEKPHFFLPGLHLGVQTTLPVEKPARNLLICGQGARFLRRGCCLGCPGICRHQVVGKSWHSVPGIRFI